MKTIVDGNKVTAFYPKPELSNVEKTKTSTVSSSINNMKVSIGENKDAPTTTKGTASTVVEKSGISKFGEKLAKVGESIVNFFKGITSSRENAMKSFDAALEGQMKTKGTFFRANIASTQAYSQLYAKTDAKLTEKVAETFKQLLTSTEWQQYKEVMKQKTETILPNMSQERVNEIKEVQMARAKAGIAMADKVMAVLIGTDENPGIYREGLSKIIKEHLSSMSGRIDDYPNISKQEKQEKKELLYSSFLTLRGIVTDLMAVGMEKPGAKGSLSDDDRKLARDVSGVVQRLFNGTSEKNAKGLFPTPETTELFKQFAERHKAGVEQFYVSAGMPKGE